MSKVAAVCPAWRERSSSIIRPFSKSWIASRDRCIIRRACSSITSVSHADEARRMPGRRGGTHAGCRSGDDILGHDRGRWHSGTSGTVPHPDICGAVWDGSTPRHRHLFGSAGKQSLLSLPDEAFHEFARFESHEIQPQAGRSRTAVLALERRWSLVPSRDGAVHSTCLRPPLVRRRCAMPRMQMAVELPLLLLVLLAGQLVPERVVGRGRVEPRGPRTGRR